jgi:Tfp pilus assembly protein PilF
MHQQRRTWLGMAQCLGACALFTGCQSAPLHVTHAPPPGEPTPKLSAAQKSDVQIAVAQSLEKNAPPQQAIAAYEQAVKQDPQRADACNRLAILYGKQGQWEQALAHHKKALAAQPGNADYHCNLGYCYYLQKRWAEAEASFKKALELAPEHARAHVNLGLVQAHTGQVQAARTSFRRGGCSEAESFSNLGFVASLENALPTAQSHYERALALDPANAAAQQGQKLIQAQLARKTAADATRTAAPAPTTSSAKAQPASPSMVVMASRPPVTPLPAPGGGTIGFVTIEDEPRLEESALIFETSRPKRP